MQLPKLQSVPSSSSVLTCGYVVECIRTIAFQMEVHRKRGGLGSLTE